jgi:hypothetical protein
MTDSAAALRSLALVAPQSFFTTEAIRRYSALYERTAQVGMTFDREGASSWSGFHIVGSDASMTCSCGKSHSADDLAAFDVVLAVNAMPESIAAMPREARPLVFVLTDHGQSSANPSSVVLREVSPGAVCDVVDHFSSLAVPAMIGVSIDTFKEAAASHGRFELALADDTTELRQRLEGTNSPWWSMRFVSMPTTKLREVGEVGDVLARHFGDSSVGHFHVSDVPARKTISVLYASGG